MNSSRKMTLWSLAAIMVLASAAGSLRSARADRAGVVTYLFTGTINFVSGTPFGLSLSTGQQVSGTLAYDLGQPPSFDTGAVAGYIQSPPSGMSLVVSDLTLQSQDYNSFQVINNIFGFDNFNGYFTPISMGGGVSNSSSLSFNLVDFTQTALSSTALPDSLNAASFSQRSGNVYDVSSGGSINFSIDNLQRLSIPVTIDIKPGGYPNSLNPALENVIPVAILTTGAFEAGSVNPAAVRFGIHGSGAASVQSALSDVDGDGDMDLILHFKTENTGIHCGDTSASLSGETFDGQAVEGSDTLNTVGCR